MVMTGDIEVQLWCGAYALFFAPEGEGGIQTSLIYLIATNVGKTMP